MVIFIFTLGIIICLVTSCIFKKSVIDMYNQEWKNKNMLYLVETLIIFVGVLFECSLLRLTITLVKYFGRIV